MTTHASSPPASPTVSAGQDRVARGASVVAALACALWLGGMLALGAVVAPIVFGTLPAPTSGDVMTTIFRRFDAVSLVCAAVVLVAEGVRAGLGRAPLRKLDVVRIAAAVIAAGLLVWEATSIAPTIQSLHAAGAVRGSGPAGLELDRVHKLAEGQARVQLLLVALALGLHVVSGGKRRTALN